MVAFSLFEAAYYSEIIRAGIQSISKGQFSASLVFRMTKSQTMRLVILPQAFRAMIPLLPCHKVMFYFKIPFHSLYVLSLTDFFRTAANIGERDGTQVEMILLLVLFYFIISFSRFNVSELFLKKDYLDDFPKRCIQMVMVSLSTDRLFH